MDNSIIIKNIPSGIYVPELCYEFSSFGNIVSAAVQADESKRSTLEGYIAFDDNFSAMQATKCMNKYKFRNRSLSVIMSSENERFRKVFVKNINPRWDECHLLKAFEDFGTIEDAKVSEDKGKSNGYGYVIFKNHFTANRAVDSMNGKVIDGYKLEVQRFKNKSERENLMENSLEHVEEMLRKSVQPNNLHVKNFPADTTEDEFHRLFQRYGMITSVKIMTDEAGASKGFGFVSFTEEQDAAEARERMNGYILRGKMLKVNFKEDGYLRKQYASLKNKAREVRIKQYKQRSQSMPKFVPSVLSYRKM